MKRLLLFPSLAASLLLIFATGCGGVGSSGADVDPVAVDSDPESIDRLVSMLDPKKVLIPNARRMGAERLGALGPKAKQAKPALEQAASADPDEAVRKAAQEALAKINAP